MPEPNLARNGGKLATPELPTSTGKRWGRPFQKGQSGNPGGRARAKENIVEIARTATPRAMRTMIAIMENEKAPYSVRAYCADKVIDRAYGKPAQQTNLMVGFAQRSLAQLTDAELLSIIEGQKAPAALSAPELAGPTIEGEVEPSVEPDLASDNK